MINFKFLDFLNDLNDKYLIFVNVFYYNTFFQPTKKMKIYIN